MNRVFPVMIENLFYFVKGAVQSKKKFFFKPLNHSSYHIKTLFNSLSFSSVFIFLKYVYIFTTKKQPLWKNLSHLLLMYSYVKLGRLAKSTNNICRKQIRVGEASRWYVHVLRLVVFMFCVWL